MTIKLKSKSTEMKGYDNIKFKLVHSKTGLEAQFGETCYDNHGVEYTLTGGNPPQHDVSSGRIYVKSLDNFNREFYPSVCGYEWVMLNEYDLTAIGYNNDEVTDKNTILLSSHNYKIVESILESDMLSDYCKQLMSEWNCDTICIQIENQASDDIVIESKYITK